MAWMPDAVVIGTPKCGSTSIFDWLGQYEGVALARNKETYFLSDEHNPDYTSITRRHSIHTEGIEGYRSAWDADDPTLVHIEATPTYLYDTEPREVLAEADACQLIAVIRAPEDRIRSVFDYVQGSMGIIPASMSFHEFVTTAQAGGFNGKWSSILNGVLRHSAYATYLRPWCNDIAASRLTVLLLEDLSANPESHVRSLASTLGVPGAATAPLDFTPSNQSGARSAWQPMERAVAAIGRMDIAGRIPRGTRESMKSLVRRVTPQRDSSLSEQDLETYAALRDHFEAPNAELRELLPDLPWHHWEPSP